MWTCGSCWGKVPDHHVKDTLLTLPCSLPKFVVMQAPSECPVHTECACLFTKRHLGFLGCEGNDLSVFSTFRSTKSVFHLELHVKSVLWPRKPSLLVCTALVISSAVGIRVWVEYHDVQMMAFVSGH